MKKIRMYASKRAIFVLALLSPLLFITKIFGIKIPLTTKEYAVKIFAINTHIPKLENSWWWMMIIVFIIFCALFLNKLVKDDKLKDNIRSLVGFSLIFNIFLGIGIYFLDWGMATLAVLNMIPFVVIMIHGFFEVIFLEEFDDFRI